MLKKIYEKNNDPNILHEAASILENGGIIIFPTDSLYAVGCHGLKERSIERICKLKNEDPKKKHLSIICYDISAISQYAKIDNGTFKLMKQCLPGPYTFILNGSAKLPKIFRNRKEVGIRMPDTEFIRELSKLIDAPIMVSSLPYDSDDDIGYITDPELIDEKWGKQVDMIYDGGYGHTEGSTIIDCTSGIAQIIR